MHNRLMNLKEALTMIADLFEEPPEKIKPETAKDDIPAWDSLGMLTLMANLDENFDILLTDEEMQNLRSVNDILDILRRNGKLDNHA